MVAGTLALGPCYEGLLCDYDWDPSKWPLEAGLNVLDFLVTSCFRIGNMILIAS